MQIFAGGTARAAYRSLAKTLMQMVNDAMLRSTARTNPVEPAPLGWYSAPVPTQKKLRRAGLTNHLF